MYPMLIIFNCRTTTMANRCTNSFIHNIGLNEENSLSHLLDKISPEIENETDLIEHSKYYNDVDFKNVLHNANCKISMLSLNCQSINAKFDKLKFFLGDVNKDHPISVICIQESWGHEEMEMSYFSLPNYSMVYKNRRLSTHGGLILYIHDDFASRSSIMRLQFHTNRTYLKAFLLNYGENRAHTKNTYLEMFIVCHYMALMI